MKKKFYILMCLASLVLMVTACGGKEKIKEKLRAATEAVKERKEATASEKGSDPEMDKQGDRPDSGAFVDPSLTPAQRKALDKENPWFARDFRMKMTCTVTGSTANVVLQKAGNVVYEHLWNSGGSREYLYVIGDEIKYYQISSANKVAQLKRTFKERDYSSVFCESIGIRYGIIYKPEKEQKEEKEDSKLVETNVQKFIDVNDEQWGGFDCEKITRKTVMDNNFSGGAQAMEALFGSNFSKGLQGLEYMEVTENIWIDKNSGVVVHLEYKSTGALAKAATNIQGQPSVSLFTFSPDPSLIPTSLEGYKLVK